MPDASVNVHVAATAEKVFGLVTDLDRMGEWSPETTRLDLKGGATAAALGVAWTGHNAANGKTWKTDAKVTQLDAGRAFAFDVHVGPIKVARWGYEIAADADGAGCTLTETWTDQRGGLVKRLGAFMTKVVDRKAHNEAGMRETIGRIKAAAEA